jgi:site-specific DNA-methyltransferase (adenine-specific)
MRPYYQDAAVTLYHCAFQDVRAILPPCDAVIADPPYGETSLAWDHWPAGWPGLVMPVARQLWCFGSMRMFWGRQAEFEGWKFAQDIIWEKHNGSGSAADRFRRVHELALHFYQGDWDSLYKSPVKTHDAAKHTIRRKGRPAHWGEIGGHTYTSEDGGPRLMRSVIPVASCHGFAVNETQKPEGIVRPLIEFSVPIGCGKRDRASRCPPTRETRHRMRDEGSAVRTHRAASFAGRVTCRDLTEVLQGNPHHHALQKRKRSEERRQSRPT